MTVELKGKSANSIPQLVHADFYNYVGIFIVLAGIFLSLYTFRYYLLWIKHLQNQTIDTDKHIYFLLSIFVAFIGGLLLASMLIL